MRPDGSQKTEVTSSLGQTNDWNVAGKHVYVLDRGHNDLLRAAFDTEKWETAAHFGRRQDGPSGVAFALPNDESFAIYSSVTRNIETLMLADGFR